MKLIFLTNVLLAVAIPGTIIISAVEDLATVIAPKMGNDVDLAHIFALDIAKAGEDLLNKDPKNIIGSSTVSIIHGVDSNKKPIKVVEFSQGVRGKERAEALRLANPAATQVELRSVRMPESDQFRIANQRIDEIKARDNNEEIGSLPGSELRKSTLDACRQGMTAHLGACAEHEAFENLRLLEGIPCFILLPSNLVGTRSAPFQDVQRVSNSLLSGMRSQMKSLKLPL